jgi:N-acetylmuramic acid 6-phosphate etherase
LSHPLLTEQPNPASSGIDTKSSLDIVRIIHAEDQIAAASLASQLPHIARAIDAIELRLRAGGRLFYIGAGTSGRLGVLDAAECPPTFQVPPTLVQGIIAGGEQALARATEASEDSAELGASDLADRDFATADTLVGIAASGRTPYVLGAIAAAQHLGALTVGISCVPNSELAAAVDIAIAPITGPEVIAGSTRMKAGTATKLALNMLSTGVMIRLGHVYNNRMVNVAPTNSKLRARAIGLVAELASLPPGQAAAALDAAQGNVRLAILMQLRHWTLSEATAALAQANGHLGALLQRP